MNIEVITEQIDHKKLQQFKVLADPTRLAIFDLLMNGTCCNCDVAETLGLSLSLVSHHLKVLNESGLVDALRDDIDARWIHFSINRDALEEFRASFLSLTDPERIQERASLCTVRRQKNAATSESNYTSK